MALPRRIDTFMAVRGLWITVTTVTRRPTAFIQRVGPGDFPEDKQSRNAEETRPSGCSTVQCDSRGACDRLRTRVKGRS
jgi:hypothetical protein